MGLYDDTIKSLIGKNPQALISFLWEDAIYDGNVERELKARTVHADFLYYVRWHDTRVILHIEFQVGKELKMPRRIWEYNALADIVANVPVYSVVIYPVQRSTIPESVYHRSLPNGQLIHSYAFRQIKLWELPADVFEQPGLENLLPLLPFTQDGQNYSTIERMIRGMQSAGKDDLLWLGEAFAGLVLTSDEDKQWIRERFHLMLDELLKESWVYQEAVQEEVQKALHEGEQVGKSEAISRFVELRFPSLLARIKEVFARATTLEQLQIIQDKIYLANTLEEATAALQEHD